MMTTLRPGGKPELLEPLTSKQEGTKVVLECRWADHSRISWFKNDIPVFSTKDVTLSQTRTSCTLTIHRASQTHNAEYKCVASNSLGKAIAQCRIDVLPAFAGRSPGRKLSSSLEKFNKVSNTGEQSKINLSPSTKPPLINGVSPHPVAPKKDNGARFPSTPPPAYQSTPPREPPSSQDRKVPSVRSNLQSTEPQSQSLQPKQSNQISQDDVKNFQTQSRVEPQTTQNRMEWRVKGPPPTFKPVSFEMVVPSHKAAAERDRTATPVQSTFVRPTFREPKEEATGLSEAGRLSPVVTKQVNAPGSKAAAVALLSNRLLAAQLKDNAFIAELRKEKSVATRPAPSKSITGSTPTGSTLTSSTPTSSTPTSSTPTASGPDSPSPRAVTPLSGRSATAGLRPMLGKSKSSDYSPPIKGLRPFSSVDIPSEPAYSLRKKGSTSSSSSLSDTDSTQRSTPPIKLSGVTSIKDRLARFSSSESLSSGSQSNTRRSNGELYKSSPSVAIGGIDALSRGAKLVSSESDHSRGSSIDGNQSHRSISPVGKSVVSEPSNKSGSVANSSAAEFESCVSDFSTAESRSSLESFDSEVGQSQLSSSGSFHSFSSRAASSLTLRSDSCESISSAEVSKAEVNSLHSVAALTPTFQLGEDSCEFRIIGVDDNTVQTTSDSKKLLTTSHDTLESPSLADVQSPSLDYNDNPHPEQPSPVTTELILQDKLECDEELKNNAVNEVEQLCEVTLSRRTPDSIASSVLTELSESVHTNSLLTVKENPQGAIMSEQSNEPNVSRQENPTAKVEGSTTKVEGLDIEKLSLDNSDNSSIEQPDIKNADVKTSNTEAPNAEDSNTENLEKPVLGSGKIKNLSKSFETSPEPEPIIMRGRQSGGGIAKSFDCSAWEHKTVTSEEAIKANTPRRSGGGGLADKLKMFNTKTSAAAPMEFGVHISTTKPLEELTKQSKSIYVSIEEKKKQQQKQTEEQHTAKVAESH